MMVLLRSLSLCYPGTNERMDGQSTFTSPVQLLSEGIAPKVNWPSVSRVHQRNHNHNNNKVE